jgi:Glycosyl transferase family 2
MKIAAVTRVRNEADIIEAFVRHHAWVDRIIVTCHICVDNTSEIVRLLASEGLPVELRVDEQSFHRQAAVVNAIGRELAEQDGVDWILALDADEFVVPRRGDDPRAAFDGLPLNRPCRLPWKTYVPTPDDDSGEANALRRIRHRRAREPAQFWKVVFLPGSVVRGGDFALTHGNHELVETATGREVTVDSHPSISLAHFPVRSSAQLQTKVLAGWLTRLADAERKPPQSTQWSALFAECSRGEISGERLQEIALAYATVGGRRNDARLVLDPVEAPFEIRYRIESAEPLHVLADAAARLVAQHAPATPTPTIQRPAERRRLRWIR